MIKYRGGKSKEIPNIMLHLPRFSGRYVEPFLGGGALYFHLEPRQAIINDINSKLIGFYQGVRNHYDTLRQELDEIEQLYTINRSKFDALKALNPNERVEDLNEYLYYALRDMFNDKADKHYSDALLYFFINKTAYSGMIRYNSRGEFNVPFGRYGSLNTSSVTRSHSLLLNRAEVFNTDYSDIFNMCNENDFVFLDPPYDCVFSDYGNELHKDGFSEANHRRLAEDFKNLPCKSMMVIGNTPLIEELYRGYIVDEYNKNYSVNIRNRFKSASKHIVVANYRRNWLNDNQQPIEYAKYPDLEIAQLALFEAPEPYGKDD